MTATLTESFAAVIAKPSSVDMLGVAISTLNMSETVSTILDWRQATPARHYVCCVCVHGIVTANRDPEIRLAINGASLATKDGMPVALWCRASGFPDSRRVSGSDLMEELCATGLDKGARHYFYGSTPHVLEQLTDRLRDRFPGLAIVGHRSPPFRSLSPDEEAAEIAAINATRPDFVWVGLGMPKQERWMARNIGKIDAAALLGVGAAFDFHAGVKRRAPGWMQRHGLEWLFRLATEPRRLARRYVIDNSSFILLVVGHLISGRLRQVRGKTN